MPYLGRSKTSEHKQQRDTEQTSSESQHRPIPTDPTHGILALQHTVGNHAVNYLLQRSQYSVAPVNDVPPIVHDVLSSPGQPLDSATRAFMEPHFGRDFSQVRIHTDAKAAESAQAVNALAYTVGKDIVFGAGQYGPTTTAGKWLLSHELAHTIQQSSGRAAMPSMHAMQVSGPNDAYEQEANQVATAVGQHVPGTREGERPFASHSMEISLCISTPTIQRFDPSGHRAATVSALQDKYSAEEIGLIYQANWERDFSQGPAKIANLVLAWKAVKQSAMQNNDVPSAAAAEQFKNAVKAVLDMGIGEALSESLGGYHYWEHMDNPGGLSAWSANRRWHTQKGSVPGYILDSRAYIKDEIVAAVDAYRGSNLGASIDNWKGGKRPSGYDPLSYKKVEEAEKKKPKQAVADRGPVYEEAVEMAKSYGAKSSRPQISFHDVAQLLGRAMHATEDFFAHSNWLEMAQEVKKGGEPSQQLVTGTFKRPDKIHSLGHKLIVLATQLRSEYLLLLNVYKREIAHEQKNPITPRSRRLIFEAIDVYSAAKEIRKKERSGKAEAFDYLGSKNFIDSLEAKGEEMMEHGQREASETSHARLAKDAPERGRDYRGALALATAADRIIFAPLREIMNNKSDEATRQQLLIQLDLVDKIIAPPSPNHPLLAIESQSEES